MRCKNCPAYWEDCDYYYGPQDWNRKLPYIQKVRVEVEKQRKIDEVFIVKQMGDMAKFFEEEMKKDKERGEKYGNGL